MNLNLCLKVLDSEQIRQTDQFTIKNEPISSLDLMERASERFVERFAEMHSEVNPVIVFCGVGNNGGDGLAISRLLLKRGYTVNAYIIGQLEKRTRDFDINYDLIQQFLKPVILKHEADFPTLTAKEIVIDAIFGSGLTRPVTGLYAILLSYINHSACRNIVAVDIASGLSCDSKLEGGEKLKVSHTISFQVPKLPFFFPTYSAYCGQIDIVNIGLNEDQLNTLPSNKYQVTSEFIASIWKKRPKYAHKGLMGRDLLIVGSKGKIGAAVLSARACLKSGAGLLTVASPKCGTAILQTAIPEAMVDENTGESVLIDPINLTGYDAVGIGPGIGVSHETRTLVGNILQNCKGGLVIDADAINIIADHDQLMTSLPKMSILTPHPGEFARMVGDWNDDYQRLELQVEFSVRHQVVLVLKGANTSISTPEGQVFFNTTGNPGLATAGSGDVLTGIITSFLGQRYPASEAALLGVYLHGLAADIYTASKAMETLIASDIINHLGDAIQTLSVRNKI